MLSTYEAADTGEADLARAAVLFLLYDLDGLTHTVFQKRSQQVLHHKGQVSLPGGAMDPEDPSLLATALRETEEEIGVPRSAVEPLGRIDEIETISGFRVTPFVGWFERGEFEFQFNRHEVAGLIEVPVAHLADPANYIPDIREFGGRRVEMPSYAAGDDLIWGATGRMVANFLDLLAAAERLATA